MAHHKVHTKGWYKGLIQKIEQRTDNFLDFKEKQKWKCEGDMYGGKIFLSNSFFFFAHKDKFDICQLWLFY